MDWSRGGVELQGEELSEPTILSTCPSSPQEMKNDQLTLKASSCHPNVYVNGCQVGIGREENLQQRPKLPQSNPL
jgi:hypothetical protein